MLKFSEIYNLILEGKQVGDVYHFTTLEGLEGILTDNRIGGSTTNRLDLYGVSTTRDKKFFKERIRRGNNKLPFGGNSIMITLDGDLLSDTYRTKPHADAKSKVEIEEWGDEREQLWYGPKISKDSGIKNIRRYIKNISMTKFGLERLETHFLSKRFYEYLENDPDLESSFGLESKEYKATIYGIYLRETFGIENYDGPDL